ncbi:hypothetical protein LshimejAT787_0902480 [Lyophyllum shimeji]|uniref:HMG box domain-containing protein n=1 Tax=Lyophyllum shimeji TaxID=47721 RepID=A0A9P3UPU9_LYOSH|nr:hypothetical protein LshimejAT787_0902480 [Lyophyllum shimeji]
MLSLLSVPFASRRVPFLAAALPQRPVFQSPSLTRSFLSSVFRAESSLAASEDRTSVADEFLSNPKSRSRKSDDTDASKSTQKGKRAKAAAKAERTVIPRGVKIPSFGPSAFTHFLANYYDTDHPKLTSETMILRSKEAAAAWAALPAYEKQKISAEARELRAKAREERAAFIASLDPGILKEINRRRVTKGKTRLIVHRENGNALKQPLNSYFMFAQEYRERHPEVQHEPAGEVSKKVAEEWRSMSDAEKEPWAARAKEALAEWHAAKERLRQDAVV